MQRAKPVAAIAGLAAAALLGACERELDPAPVDPPEDAAGLPFGESVTLRGAVASTHGPRAFVLTGDDLWEEDSIAVLTSAPIALAGAPLAVGDEVVVSGRLEPALDAGGVDDELGGDLDPELRELLGPRPVLLGDELRRLDEHARWSATETPGGALIGMTPLVTAEDPATLVGSPLFLHAVVVQDTAGDGVWIGHGSARSLFLVPEQGVEVPPLTRGDRIDVAGILRATPDATALGDDWKLAGSERRQVAERPIYLDATAITPAVAAEPEPEPEPAPRVAPSPP